MHFSMSSSPREHEKANYLLVLIKKGIFTPLFSHIEDLFEIDAVQQFRTIV